MSTPVSPVIAHVRFSSQAGGCAGETLRVLPLGHDRYMVVSQASFANGLHLGDTVECLRPPQASPNSPLQIRRVLSRGGRTTVWVRLPVSPKKKALLQRHLSTGAYAGVTLQWFAPGWCSVSLLPGDVDRLRAFLIAEMPGSILYRSLDHDSDFEPRHLLN